MQNRNTIPAKHFVQLLAQNVHTEMTDEQFRLMIKNTISSVEGGIPENEITRVPGQVRTYALTEVKEAS